MIFGEENKNQCTSISFFFQDNTSDINFVLNHNCGSGEIIRRMARKPFSCMTICYRTVVNTIKYSNIRGNRCTIWKLEILESVSFVYLCPLSDMPKEHGAVSLFQLVKFGICLSI